MYEGRCAVCGIRTQEGYGRLGELTYCPLHVRLSANPTACRGHWVGPLQSDLLPDGTLRHEVPPERWPYGSPDQHERACLLFQRDGLYCDCRASDASDTRFGAGV